MARPGHDINKLFILPGLAEYRVHHFDLIPFYCRSKAIYKIGVLSNLIERKFNVKLPSATRARKLGATCAARHLGARENSLISSQMSHNPQVHAQFYAAVRGRSEAAEAALAFEAGPMYQVIISHHFHTIIIYSLIASPTPSPPTHICPAHLHST